MSSFNSFEDKANILRAGKSTPAVSDSVNFKSRAIFKRATQKAYLLITYVGAGTWVHLFSSFFHTFRVPRIYIPLTRSHQTKLSHFRLFLFITFIMRNSACAHTQVLKCNKSEMPSSEKPASQTHFPRPFSHFSIRSYVHEYSLTFFSSFFPCFFPTFFPIRNSHNFTHEVISQHPLHTHTHTQALT